MSLLEVGSGDCAWYLSVQGRSANLDNTVGQGQTVLAAGVGGIAFIVIYFIFFFFLTLSGNRLYSNLTQINQPTNRKTLKMRKCI